MPADFRQRDGVEPSQEFDVERVDCGEYRLKRSEPPLNEGLVERLSACPEKGFFVSIESKTTDAL